MASKRKVTIEDMNVCIKQMDEFKESYKAFLKDGVNNMKESSGLFPGSATQKSINEVADSFQDNISKKMAELEKYVETMTEVMVQAGANRDAITAAAKKSAGSIASGGGAKLG